MEKHFFSNVEHKNKERVKRIREEIKKNNGYCLCSFTKNEDTKCPCKTFREQTTEGECHCGRYVKINIKNLSQPIDILEII